jgi:hypothetical protein
VRPSHASFRRMQLWVSRWTGGLRALVQLAAVELPALVGVLLRIVELPVRRRNGVLLLVLVVDGSAGGHGRRTGAIRCRGPVAGR